MCGKKFLCVWGMSVYKETFVWTTCVCWEKQKNLWTRIGFVYRLCDIKKKGSDVYTKKGSSCIGMKVYKEKFSHK